MQFDPEELNVRNGVVVVVVVVVCLFLLTGFYLKPPQDILGISIKYIDRLLRKRNIYF